jgi:hypothetical protein
MTQLSVSRRELMALAGGSTASALLVACGGDSGGNSETARFGDGDVGILNYALMLEHLTSALYAEIERSGLLAGPDLRTVREFGGQEAEHAAALAKAIERLGGKPARKAGTEFPLRNARSALELASRVENLVAAAYLGQLSNVEDSSALATLLAIHSVEGRHAAAMEILLGRPFSPAGAFAKPASVRTVLRSVEPFTSGEVSGRKGRI